MEYYEAAQDELSEIRQDQKRLHPELSNRDLDIKARDILIVNLASKLAKRSGIFARDRVEKGTLGCQKVLVRESP